MNFIRPGGYGPTEKLIMDGYFRSDVRLRRYIKDELGLADFVPTIDLDELYVQGA